MEKLRHHWITVIVMLVTLSACEQSPQFNALAPGATVLAFGDSVTYGVGANRGEDFPTLLAAETGAVLVSDIFSDVLSDDDLKADEIHPNSRGYEVFTAGLVARLTAVGLLQ